LLVTALSNGPNGWRRRPLLILMQRTKDRRVMNMQELQAALEVTHSPS
jgi:hypothetical protein